MTRSVAVRTQTDKMQIMAPIALCFLLIIAYASAFYHESGLKVRQPLKLSMSYEKMLEQARLRKQQGSQPNAAPVPVAPRQEVERRAPVSKPQSVQVSSDSGDAPFSDDMYEHLKFVISKLTNKIKSDVSLTESELTRFEESVDAILADATGESISSVRKQSTTIIESPSTVSSIPIPSPTSREVNEKPDTDSFSAFYGLGNTWNVEGMEDMTKEEYYEALNKRNAKIRAARRAETGRPMQTDDYLKSLRRPRPQ